MDARTFLDTHGEDGAKALIAALGELTDHPKKCTVGYFKQIAYGYRRPSPELAEGLVAASEAVAKQGGYSDVLDFKALLDARKIHALKAAAEGSTPDGEGHVQP